jgi:hypothetical protein
MTNESARERLSQAARTVARLSRATKVICVVMLVAASFLFLFALSRAGHRTDDFVGFSVMAIAVAALALVFWSTAAFHAAFGQSLAVLASAQEDLRALARAAAKHGAAWIPEASAPASDEAAALPEAPEAAPAPASARPVAKAEPATTKTCPHCQSTLRLEVTRCRYCMEPVR